MKRASSPFTMSIVILSFLFYAGLYALGLAQKASAWVQLFILFAILERLYETFYTSHERTKQAGHKDWALISVVTAYLGTFYAAFYEHFLAPASFGSLVVTAGSAGYAISLLVRWWAIMAAGDQWGIHSVEIDRLHGRRRLVREGPYDYLRHPYYMCVCLEIISICLILQSPRSLIAAVLIVCPLEIRRGLLEERNLLHLFGWLYLKYQNERAGFIPFKKLDNFDRRKLQVRHDLPERRKLEL